MTQRGGCRISREQLKEVDDVAQVLSEVYDVTPEYARAALTRVWQVGSLEVFPETWQIPVGNQECETSAGSC